MGSRAITTMTIGLALVLTAGYFTPESIAKLYSSLNMNYDWVLKYFSELMKSEVSKKDTELLLTPEELKSYDGSSDSKGLYLAILGEVFDVSKGAQHYKPGGGYAFFAGRDATRAYITGEFNEKGLVDDISDLKSSSLESIQDWLSFYKDEYKVVGKVIGRYYNSNGEPTKELLAVMEKIGSGKTSKWVEQQSKDVFPPCNSEWSKEKGSRVWCTNKSGGVERSWVGVPRIFQMTGKDPRCVCVRDFGPSASTSESEMDNDRGDLDDPRLKEYPGCAPDAQSCTVAHP